MAFSEQASQAPGMTKLTKEPSSDPSNPHGVGDPNDKSLRKVEKDVMIPMKMRDKAKEEKCSDVVQAFSDCCKDAGVAMVVKCRAENTALKACLTKWYQNEEFVKLCTEEYLKERSEYRRTGVRLKDMKKYMA